MPVETNEQRELRELVDELYYIIDTGESSGVHVQREIRMQRALIRHHCAKHLLELPIGVRPD